MNESDWKRRIAAMLKHAEETDNPQEAATFSDRAFELLADRGWDVADVLQSFGERREEVISKFFEVRKPFIQKLTLLNVIAQFTNCKLIRHGKVKSTVERARIFGFPSDIERLTMLWESLVVQGEHQCKIDFDEVSYHVHPPTYRRTWWQAFAVSIYERLNAAEKASKATHGTPGKELVLRDRKAKVDEAVDTAYGKLSKGRRSTVRKTDGYTAGREAGRNVDLGTGRVGTGPKSIDR